MSKDNYHNVSAVQLQKPISKTATFTTTYVDMANVGALTILYDFGVLTANAVVSTALWESDASGSGYTAVAAGDIIGTQPTGLTSVVNTGGGSNIYPVSYIGNKRYVEAIVTMVNGSNGVMIGITALKSKYAHQPITSA